MGAFDFLFGEEVDPNNATRDINNAFGTPLDKPKQSTFNKLFSDQTFLRSLGETGAKISSGTPIGQAVGEGASTYGRNLAVQREGEKVADKNQTFQEKMLAELQNGSLLSPTADNVGADMITYDGDGNITIKAKKSPPPVGPLTEQQPLEAITNKPAETSAPRQDLSNFSFDQKSGADFSGLDPADVQMILGAKQSAGALTQRAVATYLDNKYKNKTLEASKAASKAKLTSEEKKLDAKSQAAVLKRKQEIADKKEERQFKIDMKLFEKKLDKAEPGSQEYRAIEAKINNLNSQVVERGKDKPITPAERERLDNEKKRIELSVAATEETKKKTVIDQQQDAVKYEEAIIDNVNDPAIAPMMDYINQNQNKSYYYTQYEEPGRIYGTNLKGAKLPLITKAGVQMDMESVRASAEKYNMTVDDFLSMEGIGILIKGENNDYQPANR